MSLLKTNQVPAETIHVEKNFRLNVLWENEGEVHLKCSILPTFDSVHLHDFGKSISASVCSERDNQPEKVSVHFYLQREAHEEKLYINKGEQSWSDLFPKNNSRKNEVFLQKFDYSYPKNKLDVQAIQKGFVESDTIKAGHDFLAIHIGSQKPELVHYLSEKYPACFNDKVLVVHISFGKPDELIAELTDLGLKENLDFIHLDIFKEGIKAASIVKKTDWLTCYVSPGKESTLIYT